VAQVATASEGEVSVWEHMFHEVQVRGREICERTLLQHFHNDKVRPAAARILGTSFCDACCETSVEVASHFDGGMV